MIRLTKPETGNAIESIAPVLEQGLLVQGKNVERFESMIREYVGRSRAVAVNSGTSAIQCALVALGIGRGDEVILPDFTFPATANAVVWVGATPVLADIDPVTLNISTESVEARLSAKTRAVMPVDLFGLAGDIGGVQAVCQRNGLLLIEDSACALGAMYQGRRCGSFGQISILSFHPRKIVTTGEGGMVLTDEEEYARTVQLVRNHGIEPGADKVEFVMAGSNLRMNEIEACLGIAQMNEIDRLIAARRQIAAVYDRLLGEIEEIRTPIEPEGCLHTYQSYVVIVKDGIDRDRLVARMKQCGIETTIGTYAIHVQRFYRDLLGLRPGSLPASYDAFMHSLCLPIYPSMEEVHVEQVVSNLKECLHDVSTGK
jgi:perosamine synthetase